MCVWGGDKKRICDKKAKRGHWVDEGDQETGRRKGTQLREEGRTSENKECVRMS